MKIVSSAALFACLLMFLTGCNNGQGTVTGKVTWKGQPVTGGQLMFDPVGGGESPGKPGAATIAEDGTFAVSTYGNGDGAVIGKHAVSYVAPPPKVEGGSVSTSSGDPSKPGRAVDSPYEGLICKQQEVVVESGSNVIDIELVSP